MLKELLAEGVRFDPHYPPHDFADHLPMTLCALSALGASEAALLAYRDDYARVLVPVREGRPLADWREGLGQRDLYPRLLATFRQTIDDRGASDVVREVLPVLVRSLASDAFHPLIRLGYALDFDSAVEVGAALAYMASTYMDLPATHDAIDLGAALRRQSEWPRLQPNGPDLFNTGLTGLLEAGEYPLGKAADIDTCARHALDLYRSTRNFFALHMVTATQAARVCSNYIDEGELLASLTGALLAAHRIVGCPGIDLANPMPVPGHVDREHIYKYVYACTAEYKVTGDERYVEEVRGFRRNGLIPAWAAQGF